VTEAATLAAAYAVSCVGCCVALMGLMVAVGGVALPVMVVLAAVMAAERLLPGGRRLVRPVGAALLGAGAVLALAPLLAG
jgi:predicted metal-binding membrane protein